MISPQTVFNATVLETITKESVYVQNTRGLRTKPWTFPVLKNKTDKEETARKIERKPRC